jgi:hypothetical protein
LRRCWWCAWPRAPTPAAAIITAITATAKAPPLWTTGAAPATPKVRDKTADRAAGRIKPKVSEKISDKVRPKIADKTSDRTACKIAGTIARASAAIAGAPAASTSGGAAARPKVRDKRAGKLLPETARMIAPASATTAGAPAMTSGAADAIAMRGGAPASARMGLAAVVEKLVRGCGQQGAEFENWPFDAIAQIVGADEKERTALAALRESAKAAAQRLAADCPQDVPAAPSARLEAVEQGIDAALAAFDKVQPALATFYGALDDEQKARLYRDMAAPAATARETTPRRQAQEDRRAPREYGSRRDRWRAYAAAREAAARETAPRQAGAPGWSATCEEFAAVLRNWPVREIERDVRLSSAQRVAFYELVTASLKAADTLASACPAESALTPVGRMDAMRQRLAAVRAATAAIRPALVHFYEALDQGQKVRFAGMS